MPNLLEVRGLTKHYRRPRGFGRAPGVVKAVDGVDLDVPEGQTLGLVGESGCGKSTTAKMLLRLETSTSGQILFARQEVQGATGQDLRNYRSKVQAVFQDPYSSLNPRMRIFDIVAEPLQATQKLSRRELADRVMSMIAAVGLGSGTAERYPYEFSGGQRQRIAIARSLVLLPKLLILDEPVSALDVSVQAQILNLLDDLQTQFRLSYLLISHQLNVVARVCDQIAVMYLGRIVESGSVTEVVGSPQHPYTQALFASTLSINVDERRERPKMVGQPASPASPPTGCHFHPRCPLTIERCRVESPHLEAREGQSHRVSCHLADRVVNIKKLSRSETNGLG